jgi:hypothetical protein
VIEKCLFYHNQANWGGGIYAATLQHIAITHNTIYGNDGGAKGGGIAMNLDNGGMANSNIIASNKPDGIYVDQSAQVSYNCNTYFENFQGLNLVNANDGLYSFDANPEFCDTTAHNFHLNTGSPCLNTASCGPLIGAFGIGCQNELCGDANSDGKVDIVDVIFLMHYIFAGGSAPDPLWLGDVNCSRKIDISDAVYLVVYIFGDGPAPCANCK